MANLKEIRNRISSVGSTMQITSAMKMVSAAKLKRAQDAVTQMRPYAGKLREILENLSASLDLSENAYAEQREVNKILIVGITSNRGLCGGFNNNIIKRVGTLIAEDYAGKEVSVLCLGKKIKDVYKRTPNFYANDKLENMEDVYANLRFELVAEVAEEIMAQFLNKSFDKVVLVYNRFVNAATQSIETEQFLPIVPTVSSSESGDYIFEPSKMDIVEDLLPKSMKLQLYKAIRDSFASEHGARMTAMHKATDNASELQKSLKLSYNKARQAAITNEILEIVGGAEALNG
ncbi:MAG: ATP synthase F1 subunit gamma [Crocinitomicaceae bacterium]|jgi:F-type H+-transporting ATPase subunit gamma|nr:ATP synthase F1 subunit gamma [Crocinitomicaceae bacterium]MDP4724156.1 ATP synthase F1 subunit gamma [Crocinitomicaceae bacterium]MDP4739218.1 ATP synthase F1 subunit gamma [Crocinitomicaceae bacterium]MDP4799632.1 ATP synthase F1 subunit gamma [Crocinitomicaceae bacterium]MDP4806007.1 ATP synthase F1 subunit gamma [Crocinitomicaceae bacterium]